MRNGHRKMAAEGSYDVEGGEEREERPDRWRREADGEKYAGRARRQTVLKFIKTPSVGRVTPDSHHSTALLLDAEPLTQYQTYS